MADRQPTPAKPTPKHPLVGRGFQWKNKDGEIINQGAIIAVFPSRNSAVGDLALLQYDGGCSTQRLIPVAELAITQNPEKPADAQWTLYESVEAMRDHYEGVKDLAEKRAAKRAALIKDLAAKRAALREELLDASRRAEGATTPEGF